MQELKITERMLPIWAAYLLYGLLGLGVFYAFSYEMTEIEYVFLATFSVF